MKRNENLRCALRLIKEAQKQSEEFKRLFENQAETVKRLFELNEELRTQLAQMQFDFVQLSSLAALNTVNMSVQ